MEIRILHFKAMRLQISSSKLLPSRPGLNVLTYVNEPTGKHFEKMADQMTILPR